MKKGDKQMKKNELSYKDLKNYCSPATFKFNDTTELDDNDLIYGQDRGIKALEFGLSIDSKGYNLYLEGPSGVRKNNVYKKVCIKNSFKEKNPGRLVLYI
jgi:hypothetical protein